MFNHAPRHRKIKKDYQCKNLHNPFFRKAKQEKKKYAIQLYIGGSLLGFGLIIWFFLFSPVWQWDNIQIEGLTRLPADDIKSIVRDQGSDKRWLFFSQSNIFAFDAKSLTQKIVANYNFSGLTVEKSWPRTLVLKISERPYAFIWQEGTSTLYASADGYVIKDPAVSAEDQKKYPILENQTGQTMVDADNKINLKSDYLVFFLQLNTVLAMHPDLAVGKFILDRELNTLQVKFVAGPLAYFNTNNPAANQVNNLILVKNAKIKDNFNKTNYIDLRYGEKIFINPEFSN
jgi:hypothetical protein